MIIPGIPEGLKTILIAGGALIVVVALVAALWMAYRMGRGAEQRDALATSATALAGAQVAQEKREVSHAKHVEKIARGSLSPADVSRMLSEAPAENIATRAALEKTR